MTRAAKDAHFIYQLHADRPRLSRFIIFALGCGMSLGFAPFGWSLLAPFLLLPLLFVCLITSPRDARAHAFWFGFGMFLAGTYWIYISVHVYGQAALWIAVLLMIGLALIMAAIISLAGWIISRLVHGESLLLLFVAPTTWVVAEWTRGWILTGFPWLALGYGQIDTPLAGWAPLLGVYGVSLMLMISATALLVAILSTGRLRAFVLLIFALPWLVGAWLQNYEWTEPAGAPISSTIIQAGVSQDKKWQPDQLLPIMRFYARSTATVPDSQIVVWPEVAIPSVNDRVESFIGAVEHAAYRNGQSIVFGILERGSEGESAGRIFNSVFIVGGERRQAYRKRHLVPFGEYFPVPEGVRDWMKMQNLPHTDLAAGAKTQPLLLARNGAKLAVAICYEDAYGAEQLYALPEATLLINVSNDAWFGDSIAPHQHLEIARMRALEAGRYAIRSTNTGISAFIDADGKLLQTGQQFVPEVMTTKVEPRRGLTPYAAIGNKLVIGLCFAIMAVFWVKSRNGL